MSKAQTRRGSGAGRSGTARTGAGGRSRGAAGSAVSGARPSGKSGAGAQRGSAGKSGGGAQRGSAGKSQAGAQRGSATAARGASGGANGRAARPATASAKAPARPARSQEAAAAVRGKRWLLGMTGVEASTLILSVIGLGVAVYATILHYDSNITPLCSNSGAINCEAVMTSSQSVVFGIFPVAVLGMAFFLFMIAINSPWAWRAKFPAFLDRLGGRALSSRPEVIRWTRLGSIIVGMGFAIYLIYAELVQVGKICLWCTSVHIVTFLLFVIIVFHASFSSTRTGAPSRA